MLVLVEKAAVIPLVHASLERQFPGQSLTYLITHPYGMPFVFDYPKNLSWHDYPVSREARYKLDPSRQWLVRGGSATARTREAADYAQLEAGQDVLAVMGYHRAFIGCAVRMRDHLASLGKVGRWLGIRGLVSLAERDIEQALGQPLSDAIVEHACLQAKLKADFDYSFLVNAAGLLTRSYHAVGGEEASPVFSKFTVQALFALKAAGHVSEGHMHQHLANWKGTGRYVNRYVAMGSCSSRDALLSTLVDLGLAYRTSSAYLGITPRGEAFLTKLHPDCEDPDLPFRLEQWLGEPATAQAKLQRYQRTWFGKQKRFMAAS